MTCASSTTIHGDDGLEVRRCVKQGGHQSRAHDPGCDPEEGAGCDCSALGAPFHRAELMVFWGGTYPHTEVRLWR